MHSAALVLFGYLEISERLPYIGLRYQQVGRLGKMPLNRATPTCRVHALLARFLP